MSDAEPIGRTTAHIEYDFDGPRLHFPVDDVEVKTTHYKEKSNDLFAELTVFHPRDNLVTDARINLLSSSTRDQFIKRLGTLDPGPGPMWATIIEATCLTGKTWFRQGEPVYELNGMVESLVKPWRLNPLVAEGEPTIIYGPGGSGKSYFALYAALLVQTGTAGAGLMGVQGNALYLDWEDDRENAQRRRRALQHGALSTNGKGPFYRHCVAPLADDLHAIQRIVADHQIKFLVIDSLAPAAGGDNALENANRFFGALGRLHLPTLILAHVAKHGEHKSIYGSVFFHNLARSVWEIETVQKEGESNISISLRHTKRNNGPKLPMRAYRFTFEEDEKVAIEDFPPEQVVEFRGKLAQHKQIAEWLKEGPKSVRELGALLNVTDLTRIKSLLHTARYQEKHGWRQAKEKAASWQDQVWYIPQRPDY